MIHHLFFRFVFSLDIGIQLILEALILLEYALNHSKYSYHIKLITIHLYSVLGTSIIHLFWLFDLFFSAIIVLYILGAIKSSTTLFYSLDVKHILFDTLSYLILDDSLRYGLKEMNEWLLENTIHFHEENTKQVSTLFAQWLWLWLLFLYHFWYCSLHFFFILYYLDTRLHCESVFQWQL